MNNDLTGKRFGKWTVLSYEGVSKSSRDKLWLCQCDCGRKGITKGYYLTGGYSGKCKYCGTHDKENYPTDKVPDALWNRILSNAKKRNIPVKISNKEAFDIFLNQNKKCKLSGLDLSFPLNGSDLLENGCVPSLDRIDSTKGYIEGNIQWVHRDVNLMKNILAEERFLDICRLITENNK